MYSQLCVWPGAIVGKENAEHFESEMLRLFNARVKYEDEVKTNPGIDHELGVIPETGGRNDLFFYVHSDDIGHFAIGRLKFGIRWWEDVFFNKQEYLYPKEFIKNHKPTW